MQIFFTLLLLIELASSLLLVSNKTSVGNQNIIDINSTHFMVVFRNNQTIYGVIVNIDSQITLPDFIISNRSAQGDPKPIRLKNGKLGVAYPCVNGNYLCIQILNLNGSKYTDETILHQASTVISYDMFDIADHPSLDLVAVISLPSAWLIQLRDDFQNISKFQASSIIAGSMVGIASEPGGNIIVSSIYGGIYYQIFDSNFFPITNKRLINANLHGSTCSVISQSNGFFYVSFTVAFGVNFFSVDRVGNTTNYTQINTIHSHYQRVLNNQNVGIYTCFFNYDMNILQYSYYSLGNNSVIIQAKSVISKASDAGNFMSVVGDTLIFVNLGISGKVYVSLDEAVPITAPIMNISQSISDSSQFLLNFDMDIIFNSDTILKNMKIQLQDTPYINFTYDIFQISTQKFTLKIYPLEKIPAQRVYITMKNSGTEDIQKIFLSEYDYFINITAIDDICSDNCISCLNSTTCLSCAQFFNLINGSCYAENLFSHYSIFQDEKNRSLIYLKFDEPQILMRPNVAESISINLSLASTNDYNCTLIYFNSTVFLFYISAERYIPIQTIITNFTNLLVRNYLGLPLLDTQQIGVLKSINYLGLDIVQNPANPSRFFLYFSRGISLSEEVLRSNMKISFSQTPDVNFTYNVRFEENQTIILTILPEKTLPNQDILFIFLNNSEISSYDHRPLDPVGYNISTSPIPSLCMINCEFCSLITECLKCIPGYSLFNHQCYDDSSYSRFNIIQDNNNPNIVYLIFNEEQTLMRKEFYPGIKLNLSETSSEIYDYTISFDNYSSFTIEFFLLNTIGPQVLSAEIQSSLLENKLGLPLFNNASKAMLKPMINTNSIQTIFNTKDALQSSGSTYSSAMILSLNPALLWSILPLIQNYYYLLLINVNIPLNLLQILSIFKIGTLSIENFWDSFSEVKSCHKDGYQKFQDQNIDACFLISSPGIIIMLMGSFGLYYIFFYALRHIRIIPPLFRFFFSKYIEHFRWKLAFNLVMGSILNISLNAFLEMCFMDSDTTTNFISALAAQGSMFMILCFITLIYYFTNRLFKFNLAREKRKKYHYTSGLSDLFFDINVENPKAIYTHFFVACRRLLTGFGIVAFYNFPLLQISFLGILNFTMAIFYFKVNPFRQSVQNLCAICEELFGFLSLILFIALKSFEDDIDKSIQLGWMVIYLIMTNLLLSVCLNTLSYITNIYTYIRTQIIKNRKLRTSRHRKIKRIDKKRINMIMSRRPLE